VIFYLPEKAAEIFPEQLRFPAPDLAIEVLAPSTSRRDRGVKFADYAAHGVQEYWIVDPEARTVERYRLTPLGEYACSAKVSGDQLAQSEVLPGFKVPARAFFEDDANLAALRTLLK
jgi:Uma2 family endonuclease